VSVVALLGSAASIGATIYTAQQSAKATEQNSQAVADVRKDVDALEILSRSRGRLRVLGPSRDRLQDVIRRFDFNDQPNTSVEEGKLLMAFLGAQQMSHKGRGATSGSFGDDMQNPYEVSIWTNTYDKPNVYGVRFGLADSTYWGCNDSYFEVEKLAGGKIRFNEPTNFAECGLE
jgi:hypothetical protein